MTFINDSFAEKKMLRGGVIMNVSSVEEALPLKNRELVLLW